MLNASASSRCCRADLSREFTVAAVPEEAPGATLVASPQLPAGAETREAVAKAPVKEEPTTEPSPTKEESADAAAVRPSILPPSWALLASSYGGEMDSSMVLTGISMALPSSSSPQGDALDFEQQDSLEVVPAGGNLDSILEESAAVAASMGLPVDESAEHQVEEEEAGASPGVNLDNIFEESAALGESLEKDAGNPVAEDDTRVKLFGMKTSGGGAGASASAEFSLGCAAPSGRSSFRKTSRLQAPRSSFHFFDTTKVGRLFPALSCCCCFACLSPPSCCSYSRWEFCSMGEQPIIACCCPLLQATAPTEKAKAVVGPHESKSIDDLFNVVTPVRFRFGCVWEWQRTGGGGGGDWASVPLKPRKKGRATFCPYSQLCLLPFCRPFPLFRATQSAAEPHLHASYEPQISGKKAVRDRALYPGRFWQSGLRVVMETCRGRSLPGPSTQSELR